MVEVNKFAYGRLQWVTSVVDAAQRSDSWRPSLAWRVSSRSVCYARCCSYFAPMTQRCRPSPSNCHLMMRQHLLFTVTTLCHSCHAHRPQQLHCVIQTKTDMTVLGVPRLQQSLVIRTAFLAFHVIHGTLYLFTSANPITLPSDVILRRTTFTQPILPPSGPCNAPW